MGVGRPVDRPGLSRSHDRDTTMPADIDVKTTEVVYRTPTWRIFMPNIAIATGVTPDGRTVEGVGTSRLSADRALDSAVENLKANARNANFSFEIKTLEGGQARIRVERLNNRGEYQIKSLNTLFTGQVVEIAASREGRTVDAEGKPGLWGRRLTANSWGNALSAAVESAQSRFDRVGRTSIDD